MHESIVQTLRLKPAVTKLDTSNEGINIPYCTLFLLI